MDDRRFDALTRALAQGSSRRTALKGLVGGVLGGAVLTTRPDRASAGVQMPCDPPCDECSTCTNGVCISSCDGYCCDGVCASECCVASDCDPATAYYCRTPVCDDGICTSTYNCSETQRCCGLYTPDAHCADCCSDDQCPGCQVCNASGVCEQPECCGDSDCASVCGECVEGTCVTRCTTAEYCCAYANDCRLPGECCTDDECPCGGACSGGTCYPDPPCGEGEVCCEASDTCQECCANTDCTDPCEICVDGACVGACSQSEECCDNECVAIGTCCKESGEACSVTDGPGTQGNCCEDLLCCPGGNGGYCAECCSDNDCGECGYCSLGVCYGECSERQECCDGDCVAIGTCCQDEIGAYCTFGEPDPGDDPVVCCDGLLCCETERSAACAECCDDSDCDDGGQCDDGTCSYPLDCTTDAGCPKGTCCCKDGSCSSKCCDKPHPPKPPKPPKPAPPASGASTTLPNTGTGGADEPSSGPLGAAALGAAAALFAANKLRNEEPPAETTREP